MKRIALVMLPALALMTSPAFSQTQSPAAGVTQQIIATQEADQSRADAIVGAKVMTGTGKDAQEIGSIQDLLFDKDNKLIAAMIGTGGFLGVGEKTVAVSWGSLEKVERDGKVTFVSKLSREELEQAPAFKTTEEQKAAQARQQRLEQQQQQRGTQNPAMPQGSRRSN